MGPSSKKRYRRSFHSADPVRRSAESGKLSVVVCLPCVHSPTFAACSCSICHSYDKRMAPNAPYYYCMVIRKHGYPNRTSDECACSCFHATSHRVRRATDCQYSMGNSCLQLQARALNECDRRFGYSHMRRLASHVHFHHCMVGSNPRGW